MEFNRTWPLPSLTPSRVTFQQQKGQICWREGIRNVTVIQTAQTKHLGLSCCCVCFKHTLTNERHHERWWSRVHKSVRFVMSRSTISSHSGSFYTLVSFYFKLQKVVGQQLYMHSCLKYVRFFICNFIYIYIYIYIYISRMCNSPRDVGSSIKIWFDHKQPYCFWGRLDCVK